MLWVVHLQKPHLVWGCGLREPCRLLVIFSETLYQILASLTWSTYPVTFVTGVTDLDQISDARLKASIGAGVSTPQTPRTMSRLAGVSPGGWARSPSVPIMAMLQASDSIRVLCKPPGACTVCHSLTMGIPMGLADPTLCAAWLVE